MIGHEGQIAAVGARSESRLSASLPLSGIGIGLGLVVAIAIDVLFVLAGLSLVHARLDLVVERAVGEHE